MSVKPPTKMCPFSSGYCLCPDIDFLRVVFSCANTIDAKVWVSMPITSVVSDPKTGQLSLSVPCHSGVSSAFYNHSYQSPPFSQLLSMRVLFSQGTSGFFLPCKDRAGILEANRVVYASIYASSHWTSKGYFPASFPICRWDLLFLG